MSPQNDPPDKSTALYSVEPDGTMVDGWIWNELLGDDDLDEGPYRTVIRPDGSVVPKTPTHLGGAGSGNFGHSGRPGEIGGSGEGDGDDESSAPTVSSKDVKTMMPTLASAAQAVYDDWDESDEDTYAGGGICHIIADKIADKLIDKGIEATTVSAQIGEQHVWVVAKLTDGVYSIDIPPSTYESGGGYTWRKLKDVQITKDDVIVDRIDVDPSKFEDYLDMGGAGSGNFGHGGRPGEVGGSSGGVPAAAISRVPTTEKFTNLDPDDDYVYHVTLVPTAERIATEGLHKGRGFIGTSGVYTAHSKGRLFVTERSGVSFWQDRAEAHAFDQYDDPPDVAVLRIKKSDMPTMTPDPEGSRDAGRTAYYIQGSVHLGGEGSGNFGHAGRPGEIGGSGGGRTDSPAFKAWFKDSKIVNGDGSPKVLYHGTTKDIDEFKHPGSKAAWDTGFAGEGYYFGDAPTANIYAGERKAPDTFDAEGNVAPRAPSTFPKGANLVPVFLQMEKPLRIQEVDTRKGGDDAIVATAKAAGIAVPTGVDGLNHTRLMPGLSKQITAALREKGHDGVIYTWASGNYSEYMVLDPTQIKSAIGNTTFDPKNPKIALSDRFLLGGEGSGNFGHSGRPGEVGGSGAGKSQVPKAPGTTPIPPDTIRAYHYTNAGEEAFANILENGLSVEHSRGSTYGEPNVIWFSTAKPGDFKRYVEVHLKPEELEGGVGGITWSLKGKDGSWKRAENAEERQQVIDRFNESGDNFAVGVDKVPASRIVTHSEPWMAKYHQIVHPKADLKDLYDAKIAQIVSGKLDPMMRDPDWAKVFTAIKAEYGGEKGEKKVLAFNPYRERLRLFQLGGEGSGNFGHEGRPGEVGGSGKGRGPKFEALIDQIRQPDGGFTVQTTTGESPTHGFSVSIHPDRCKIIPVADLKLAHLVEFADQNADLLGQDGKYFGAWHNPENGQVYLDISTVTQDRAEAERLGQEHDQISFFDLGEGKVIDTPKKVIDSGNR